MTDLLIDIHDTKEWIAFLSLLFGLRAALCTSSNQNGTGRVSKYLQILRINLYLCLFTFCSNRPAQYTPVSRRFIFYRYEVPLRPDYVGGSVCSIPFCVSLVFDLQISECDFCLFVHGESDLFNMWILYWYISTIIIVLWLSVKSWRIFSVFQINQ